MSKKLRGLVRVQRGLVGSALACCKAGPSSNLGSAPHGGSAHWADSYGDGPQRMFMNEGCMIVWMYLLYCKEKNKKQKEWHTPTKPLKKFSRANTFLSAAARPECARAYTVPRTARWASRPRPPGPPPPSRRPGTMQELRGGDQGEQRKGAIKRLKNGNCQKLRVGNCFPPLFLNHSGNPLQKTVWLSGSHLWLLKVSRKLPVIQQINPKAGGKICTGKNRPMTEK